MASITHTTSEGERVDEIANKLFGKVDGVTEWILSNNRGLADYGSELPAGVVIEIPELPGDEATEVVQLWQ